ncbi:GNAT family N-acetyltransferase [Fulvivirgaceae bacterium BMA10]|uniref:GNAT family N-acetyltransferase n=1 Tax=Splendidivirga corallicola TaxID=3051826 RepID=A0ABT8KZF9_9BACT|nr:GNAT family N-acetyltransferase [Fulvivirgaceae bacterium BMA10]
MKVHFKLANKDDLQEILDMMEDFNAIDQYDFNRKTGSDNILEFINNEVLGRLWLIMDNHNIIGYIALTFGFSFEYQGKDAFIDELYLKKSFRNKGIGNTTMDFVIDQAKKLRVRAIHLEVERHNESGNSLYTKHGFKGNQRNLLTKILSGS